MHCGASVPPEEKDSATPGAVNAASSQPLPSAHSAAFLGRRDVVPRPSPAVVRPGAPRVPAAIPARPAAPVPAAISAATDSATRPPTSQLPRTPAEMERRNAAAVAAATAAAAANSNWVVLKEKADQGKNAVINA